MRIARIHTRTTSSKEKYALIFISLAFLVIYNLHARATFEDGWFADSDRSAALISSTRNVSREALAQFQSCVSTSGFNFRPWDPRKNKKFTWRVMSLVQMEESQPSGFPARCDWVVGSRPVHRGDLPANTTWGRPDVLPGTIFLQTDELQKFHDALLPCMPETHRFVIITGDHDRTTPRQTDKRYPVVFRPGTWDAWLADERILHLFIEHLDTPAPASRVTPIPLGLNPKEHEQNNPDPALTNAVGATPISNRPVKIIFTNRVREGRGQWKDRASASALCEALPHCDVRTRIPKNQYTNTIQEYTFLLCVHGGGVDPNPNLFQALLSGLIPIIGPFAGQTMYKDMPVVVTDGDWESTNSTFLSQAYLAEKLQQLAPYYEDPAKRADVLEKLTSQYWWDKVEAAVSEFRQTS